MVRVLFQVVLPIKIKKKPGVYVSSCDVLDVHSQGYTEAAARKNIEEAVRLFITGCFEMGTLDEVLKECGFQIAAAPPRKRPGNKNFITVPIPFLAKNHCRTSCHV
jgi:predicted RNase H-like HicB family nuclease